MFKYLFYDIIPEIYNIKWYKDDFNSKLDYYYWLPFQIFIFLNFIFIRQRSCYL